MMNIIISQRVLIVAAVIIAFLVLITIRFIYRVTKGLISSAPPEEPIDPEFKRKREDICRENDAQERAQQAQTKLPLYTLAQIDEMEGGDFEYCMMDIYESLGYSVDHTPLSGDYGADLLLKSKEGIRTAVQCKRYSDKVPIKAVQEVVASKAIHSCTNGIVVTNSYFTDSAKQLANANNVELIDRDGLTKLINKASTCRQITFRGM